MLTQEKGRERDGVSARSTSALTMMSGACECSLSRGQRLGVQGADFGEYDNDGWLSPHHSGTNPVCYSTEKAVISGVHSLWCYGMAGTDARYAATRHWSHVALPSGTTGDGALVSDSYYAGSV